MKIIKFALKITLNLISYRNWFQIKENNILMLLFIWISIDLWMVIFVINLSLKISVLLNAMSISNWDISKQKNIIFKRMIWWEIKFNDRESVPQSLAQHKMYVRARESLLFIFLTRTHSTCAQNDYYDFILCSVFCSKT
jgi:hypothetical protein